ncbi:glycosyltransferase [Mycobacterium sp. NPDC006124]|uniref:glycosyltransferase n=1 Tax=Mycobacterium sp. NPDC006124 TaxID=3156729 RepID=UPI0033A9AD16
MTPVLDIALIAHNRFPIRQPLAGGLEAHIWHLARALAEGGHRVTLFAAADSDLGSDLPGLTISPLPRSSAAGRPFPRPGAVWESDQYAFLDLMRRLVDQTERRFDVIHNHCLHHVPIHLAPRLRTPMLTTLHTPPLAWLESALGTTGGAGSSFAAVSGYTADSWRHVVADRMHVVPNGVDPVCWPPGPGGDYLVWSGRIVPEKGTRLAIAAAARAGRRLVLAGPIGNAEYFREYVEPRLGDDVRYAGHLDQNRLASLVGCAAAALVTPLWDEPYCLVAAEAAMCGTPVVAFARGGIPEVIDSQSGRLVTPGDVAAMAAAIPEAIGLPREAVRHSAVMRCSARSMVTRYLAIYRNLIDERKAAEHDWLLRASPRSRASRPGDQHLRTPA